MEYASGDCARGSARSVFMVLCGVLHRDELGTLEVLLTNGRQGIAVDPSPSNNSRENFRRIAHNLHDLTFSGECGRIAGETRRFLHI